MVPLPFVLQHSSSVVRHPSVAYSTSNLTLQFLHVCACSCVFHCFRSALESEELLDVVSHTHARFCVEDSLTMDDGLLDVFDVLP